MQKEKEKQTERKSSKKDRKTQLDGKKGREREKFKTTKTGEDRERFFLGTFQGLIYLSFS